jgi:hypothetical protein
VLLYGRFATIFLASASPISATVVSSSAEALLMSSGRFFAAGGAFCSGLAGACAHAGVVPAPRANARATRSSVSRSMASRCRTRRCRCAEAVRGTSHRDADHGAGSVLAPDRGRWCRVIGERHAEDRDPMRDPRTSRTTAPSSRSSGPTRYALIQTRKPLRRG